MNFLKLLLAFLPLTITPLSAATNCQVSFKTTAQPGFLAIDSDVGTCQGEITKKAGLFSGKFKSQLKDFDTGIELRNKHLRDKYLQVGKYPEAVFTFENQKDDGELEGILTIKKDSRPIKVSYAISKGKVNAKFGFEVKDYPSLGVPSWLGVTAAGRVDVDVEFTK